MRPEALALNAWLIKRLHLPEPDSPTIPIVSPLFSVKLTLFTAVTTFPSVWNLVTKLKPNKVHHISEN